MAVVSGMTAREAPSRGRGPAPGRPPPPRPACPRCHSADLGWREASGAGTVYTCTVVRHPTHFAFADKIPYVIALVELAEGPRLITGITGIAPADVRAGMPVRAVFREVAD